MTDRPIVQHFSDILCIWAYVAEIRLEKLIGQFSDRVRFQTHFCSVFPDTAGKIEAGWGHRGGAAAYGAHVGEVAAQFDHIRVHGDVWRRVRPASSTAAHLFIKAAMLAEEAANGAQPLLQQRHFRLTAALRRAFFADAADIATWQVQRACADQLGLDVAAIEARLRSGEAAAALDRDMALAQALKVTGSPTFVMNEGRQTLYGNVGYHLLEANIQELLRAPGTDEASWC